MSIYNTKWYEQEFECGCGNKWITESSSADEEVCSSCHTWQRPVHVVVFKADGTYIEFDLTKD